MVVLTLQPFSFYENQASGGNIGYDAISVETLHRYMDLFTRSVEAKNTNTLLKIFALVLDGWFHVELHFIAIFPSFPTNTFHGFEIVLFALAPMEDESSLGASEHKKPYSSYSKHFVRI